MINPALLCRHFLLASSFLVLGAAVAARAAVPEIVVTNDLVLAPGAQLPARLIVRASHITIDGAGATLVGPGQVGEAGSLENAGIGVLMEGTTGVTLKNLKVRGFSTGVVIRQAQGVTVTNCDLSDNYHNPKHDWGELPARGGIVLEQVRLSVFVGNRANRVWDAIHLIESDDNLIDDNDFSHCSNTCAKLWRSSRNKFLNNNLSYGIRIDRAAGEVHARDSTSVLIETGSNDNYWYRNDITQGGDGVFIRVLNRWVSRGNVFVENDTSYANNNCVESWSPGNIFIRNKANHGSYGFWMGGSDQTVLIGNEAAFNGRPDGNHNAPEPGFTHGGIVVVGGSGSHTLIEGNYLHDNNGAGLAFRGDEASGGRAWRTEHWIVQQNRIANNQFGIWGRWGDNIVLAGNVFTNNAQGNSIRDTTHLVELPVVPGIQAAPSAELVGPDVATVGQSVRFDATTSRDPQGRAPQFQWWLNGEAGNQPILERTFDKPGFYRLGLTVQNGALAALAWRDLLVVGPVARELGTEGQASQWGYDLEGNADGKGRIIFSDDPNAIVGSRCLRLTPNPYPGAYATAIFPAARNAGWNFAGRKRISFWIRAENPNLPGFQSAGPLVRLLGQNGHIEYKPAKDANLLNDPPFSEGRWRWMPVSLPLEGDASWQRTATGQVQIERIDAISIGLDSFGGDPFTIWLDGLAVE